MYHKLTKNFWNVFRSWETSGTSANVLIHCCTQKTASQWFKHFFADPIFRRYSRTECFDFVRFREEFILNNIYGKEADYELQRLLYNDIDLKGLKLKPGKVYTSFYVGPSVARKLVHGSAKMFFVLRDPRDIAISWYYSAKESHSSTKRIEHVRSELHKLNLEDGLKYSIDQLSKFGLFDCIGEWLNVPLSTNERIYLYEDLVLNYQSFATDLFHFLDVSIPERDREALLMRHGFENYSNGRRPGEVDVRSHYRKASVMEWEDVFSNSVSEYFSTRTNHLERIYEERRSNFKVSR